MIYGDLSLRDRLIRALVGGALGAAGGFFIMLRWDMGSAGWRQTSTFLVPATCLGAAIGGFLAFRRKKIGA